MFLLELYSLELHFFGRLLDKWPNTYTFTKAIAEDVVRTQAQDLPLGVFRPSISKYWKLV